MKLCCSSRSFARSLHSGALTQLEWIDRCAGLAVDGIEFGAAHFPRCDADYLAQLKKLCVDRGLTVASLALDLAFGDDVDPQIASVSEWIERAASLGAPLVRFGCAPVSGSPGVAWRELVRGLKSVCAAAKASNVTLAIEAEESTLVENPADVKRAFKECDSAWLRSATTTSQLSGERKSEWIDGLRDAVVVVYGGGAFDQAAALLRTAGYIGFVSLESAEGSDESSAVSRTVDVLRGYMR